MSVAAEGRRLLRLEVRNSETPIEKKPAWIKTTARMGPGYRELHALVKREGLHTVCQEAGCPNIFQCWEDREATFLIGGDQCTRRCDFCQIDTGRPEPLDRDEPRRVAESVQAMGLRYATVTGVARDDLDDEGPGCMPRRSGPSTGSIPAPALRSSHRISRASLSSSSRCSMPHPRCSPQRRNRPADL